MRQGAAVFLSFSAAVFAAVYVLPDGLWLGLGLAALLPALWCLWRKRRLGLLIALGVSAALLWCAAYRLAVFRPVETLDKRRTQVTVTPSEMAGEGEYGWSLPCYILGDGLPIRAVLYGDEVLASAKPGDTLTVTADCTGRTLQDQRQASDPASKGIFITLRARGTVHIDPAERLPWWSLPRWWGQRLAKQIEAAFPSDVAPLIAAMAAGERGGVSNSDYTALSRSGIAHLLAVSGMHVCFLVSLLSFLTGADPRRRAAVCLPVVAVFTLAVGGSASALRSCVIWAFALLAPVLGRENDPWSALSAALCFLLLLNPLSAANVGLQLSFAAVAGITLVTPRASKALARLRFSQPGLPAALLNRFLRLLCDVLSSTLGALVFTIPISAWYFGTLSLAAPLTNLLVLPVAALVFALGLVTGLTGFLSPALAAGMGAVFAWPARYVLAVARGIGSLPYSAVSLTGAYYPAFLLCAYALALIAALWRGQRRRWWIFTACGCVVLCASILFTRLTFHSGDLTVAVLDVGQGQSVLLRSQGETALVDCGGSPAADPGGVAADYLLGRGERRVDKLILTHYHDDHVNGLAALFDRLEIGEVVLPRMEEDLDRQTWILALAEEERAGVTWIDEDREAALGGAVLQIFSPLGSGEANEKGLSVLASAGDFDVLITGDMGTTVEERLVKYHRLPRCEVLVAGHHGSAGSNGETLLNAIQPQTALISVGSNTYGHPSEETLERLSAIGAALYRTDLNGTLTVTARSSGKGG